MDCFQDFCIACDKATSDSPYCSQACRMADLEKASLSGPHSPTTSTESTSGFHLPAAYALRSSPSSPTDDQQSYFPAQYESSRCLSPSSSRSSLSSSASGQGNQDSGITEQARKELRGYFSSFDKTRLAKRRSSLK